MDNLHAALQYSTKRENIVFREKASDGIWVSFLLPVAVVLSGWRSECPLYQSCTFYSLNLLLNVILLLYHVYINKSLYVTNRINILCAIPSTITMFFYIHSLNLDFRQSLCYTVANALIYFEGLPFILKVFPNSFTFGEANVVIQGLSLFLYSAFTRLNNVLLKTVPNDEYNISTTVLQVGHVGILILCLIPFVCHSMRNPLGIYILILMVTFGFINLSLNYILEKNPFLWLWSFLMKKERFYILMLWLACSAISGVIFWHRIKIKKKADTVLRKYFHILAGVVFITGVSFDISLIYFASGCVFAVFILLEVFRVVKIPPLYEFLQNAYLLYADEKDSGIIALTPIYLLVGFSLPLWLHPLKSYTSKEYLQLLSGVLCIGIGDTCASVIGKIFGKRHWKGSKKTMEGTAACICGQSLFVFIVAFLGNMQFSAFEYFKIFWAIIIPSFVEALTDQIDNIILPLITYIILMI